MTWKNTYGKKTDITAQKYTVQYSLDGYKWSNATTGATGNSYTIQKLKGGNMYHSCETCSSVPSAAARSGAVTQR